MRVRSWLLVLSVLVLAACGNNTPAPSPDAGGESDGDPCGTAPCPAGMVCALFGCTTSACPVCQAASDGGPTQFDP